MDKYETESADAEKLARLCRNLESDFKSRGVELIDNVRAGGEHVAFALANDECGFLINGREKSLLRGVVRLDRAARDLRAQEPKSRVFGILLANDVSGMDGEFMRYCSGRGIAILTENQLSSFVAEKLRK